MLSLVVSSVQALMVIDVNLKKKISTAFHVAFDRQLNNLLNDKNSRHKRMMTYQFC